MPAAALRVIAIDPRGALGVFHAGWDVLAYQIEDGPERQLVLRWVD